jgi:hypothetical protein
MMRELTECHYFLYGHGIWYGAKLQCVYRREFDGEDLRGDKKERFAQRNHKDTAVHEAHNVHGGPFLLLAHTLAKGTVSKAVRLALTQKS